MKAKMKLGIHTAMAAGKLALTAMLDTTVWNMMYVSMRASPMPNAIPIPFFRFRAEMETPMMVRMNVAKDDAPRFQYSTSNFCMLANPLAFCLFMCSSSCGMVSVISMSLEAMRSCGMTLMTVSSLEPLLIISRLPCRSLVW